MASEPPPPDGGGELERSDEPSDDKPLGRDDRVSAWPATFEEVVKAMLNTPPMKRPKKRK